jgi:hypothetical protein
MIRAAGFLFLCNCANVSLTSTQAFPILLGPVDRIGGSPAPFKEPSDERTQFEGESGMYIYACLATAYPVVSVTRPNGDGFTDFHAMNAFAQFAGKQKLADLSARLSEINVGAWSSYLAGCYGHHWWVAPRGAVMP